MPVSVMSVHVLSGACIAGILDGSSYIVICDSPYFFCTFADDTLFFKLEF